MILCCSALSLPDGHCFVFHCPPRSEGTTLGYELQSCHRQTDRQFKLGHEPTHPPTLFQAGSASASPTLLGLTGITSAHHGCGKVLRLTRWVHCISHATRTYRDYISSPWVWKRYNASPAEPRRPVAPLVRTVWGLLVLLHRLCITERLEEDVGEEPPVKLGIVQSCQPAPTSCL